jgi:hypothetical protein
VTLIAIAILAFTAAACASTPQRDILTIPCVDPGLTTIPNFDDPR